MFLAGSIGPLTINFFPMLVSAQCVDWAETNNVRVKRQEEAPKKEESFEVELCKDKDAGEWFRLVAGEGDNCRDVIQCTSSVSFQLQ